MSKQFKQWLDEFIENGADATDVVNGPEDAGGGTGESYRGPYYIRSNQTLPTAGKIATQNIIINVPIKPEELNDGEIAYNNGYQIVTESVEGDVVWFYNDKTSCDESTYDTKYIYKFNDDYGIDTISMGEMEYCFIAENGGYEHEHSTNEYSDNIYYDDELNEVYYNAIRDGEYFIGFNSGSWAVLQKTNVNLIDGDFYKRYEGDIASVPYSELDTWSYYQYNGYNIQNVDAHYVSDVGVYAVGSGYEELCSLPQESGESTTTATSRGTYVITKE